MNFFLMFQMIEVHSIFIKLKRLSNFFSNFLWIGPNVIQSLGVQQTIHEIHFHRTNWNPVAGYLVLHSENRVMRAAVFCILLVHFIRVKIELIRWQNFFNRLMNLIKLVSILLLNMSSAPLMGMTINTSQNCNKRRCRRFNLILIVILFVVLILIKHFFILFQIYNKLKILIQI